MIGEQRATARTEVPEATMDGLPRRALHVLFAPARWLPDGVARLPVSVHVKLLGAFLAVVFLFIAMGAVGLLQLGAANDRAEGLGNLSDNVEAYYELQTAISSDLTAAAAAFVAEDDDELDRSLRQLGQSSYQFERIRVVAPDPGDVSQIEEAYSRYRELTFQIVSLLQAGDRPAALELYGEARPVAADLQRLTGALILGAQSAAVTTIDDNANDYAVSRRVFTAVAAGSVVLALVLGYAIAWSVIDPVRRMDSHLVAVTSGDFSGRVSVASKDELGALATNLNRMTGELGRLYHELETASRHKSEFLANMSHELRTPMNAIIGFSEVLLDKDFPGELNERQREYIADINDSGKHLLSLINDILDLSKIEAGRMDLELNDFVLADAMQNGLSMVKERASRRGVSLSLEVDPAIGVIEADERKVKQVIFNLLTNAVKFTSQGGRVSATALRAGDEVRIAIHDTGIGISTEDQAAIFDEFRQGTRHESADQEGTGLGLALARQLVEMHRGRIWVESEPGKGSTFTFAIPARTEPAAAEPAPAELPGEPDPLTVLVIEDDPKAAQLLCIYLEAAGLRPLVCPTGEEGLAMAATMHPGTIILDILLPGRDGWDILADLKGRTATSAIPVVIASSVDERGKGFALGATDYLLKPVSRDALLDTIRRAAGSTGSRNPPCKVLAIDDDPLALELTEAVLAPEGFAVLRANGGAAGVEAARRERPALIILDLLMPEMDGFAVIESLRSDPATDSIPIVVLTGKTLSGEDRERLNSRVRYLARKSDFDRAGFVKLVRSLCGAKGEVHVR